MTIRDAAAVIWGLARILRLDANGFAAFRADLAGFWQSFLAALIVMPFFLLTLAVHMAEGGEERPVHYVLAQLIAYGVGWVLYPLLMVYIADHLDRGGRYFAYMVPYNWFHVVQSAVLFPIPLIGLVNQDMAAFLVLMGLSAAMMYRWFIASRTLQIDGMTAVALVAIDFLLSLLVSGIAYQIG